MLASGLGAAITDTIFNPLEMLKVRVQTSDTTFPVSYTHLTLPTKFVV